MNNKSFKVGDKVKVLVGFPVWDLSNNVHGDLSPDLVGLEGEVKRLFAYRANVHLNNGTQHNFEFNQIEVIEKSSVKRVVISDIIKLSALNFDAIKMLDYIVSILGNSPIVHISPIQFMAYSGMKSRNSYYRAVKCLLKEGVIIEDLQKCNFRLNKDFISLIK